MNVPHNYGKGAMVAWLRERAAYQGDDCLIWPGSRNWAGYGVVSVRGKNHYAHRFMCALAHGAPPNAKHHAAHTCNKGQEGCVNPRHLTWKSPRDNLLDRRAAGTLTKKRWTRTGSTLSQQDMDVIQLLKPYANQRIIAAIFGISYQHVSVIQQGKLVCQRKSA